MSNFLLSFLFLIIGFVVGWTKKTAKIKSVIKRRQISETLSGLLKNDWQRKLASLAYHDSDDAYKNFQNYLWDPKMALTPFVGYAPIKETGLNSNINSLQFRADSEVDTPKLRETYRVFLVGGSTAFSSGAPSMERTIGGYLQKALRNIAPSMGYSNVDVYTVAAPAWASAHERIVIENMICDLEPDIVISLSGVNDAHWAWNFKNPMWFRTYADNHFWNLLNAAYEAADYPMVKDPIKDLKTPIASDNLANLATRNIKLASYALEMADCPYVFALQPILPASSKKLAEWERHSLEKWHPAQIAYFKDYYNCLAEKLVEMSKLNDKFTFIDLSGLFNGFSEDETFFLDSYHFGDKGNELVAGAIFNYIKSMVKHNPFAKWNN